MSLLMEALRKAEEAKRKGQTPNADASDDTNENSTLSLVPHERDVAAPQAAPESAPPPPDSASDSADEAPPRRELELEHEPIEEKQPPTRKRVRVNPASRQSEAQLAAASVFAAKQQTQKRTPAQNPLLLLLAVLLPAVGGTLWYLQQDSSSGILLNPDLASMDVANRTLEPLPAGQTASETQDGATAADGPAAGEPNQVATAGQLATDGAETQPPATATMPAAAAATAAPEPAANAAPPASQASIDAEDSAPPGTQRVAGTDAPAPQQTAPEPAPAVDTPEPGEATSTARLQVSLNREAPTVNSTLQSAWDTLQAGDLDAAARLYTAALQELPNNRDALLGLAVIQTRSGRLDEARRLYAQALTLNPQDPLARTGLLQTMTGSGSDIERELLGLRDSFPQLAPVHFALGNLYAARQRWSEAQSAYFDALTYANRSGNGPVSPDYAFNLAVSLEQLQQPRAALDYYRQAQAHAQQHAPGFDPALLRSRLAYLEQNLP